MVAPPGSAAGGRRDGISIMRLAGLLLACLTLAACASLTIDPMTETRFYIEGDGQTFSYVGYAEDEHGLKRKEPERLALLGRWLTQSRICAKGYAIMGRKEEKRPTGEYNIYYAGRCS